MDKIFASAPGRVFVSGDSVMEFGARALVVPAEFEGKRNVVTFSFLESTGKFTAYEGNKIGTLLATGRTRGDEALKLSLEAAKAALLANGYSPDKLDSSFSMSLERSVPVTAGSDAAVCAAVFAGVFDYLGNKPNSRAAFKKEYSTPESEVGETDAILMSSGAPMTLRKEFLLDGTIRVKTAEVPVNQPQGTVFLYADPKVPENKSAFDIACGVAIANKVVTSSGRVKPAKDMTANERAGIADAFTEITDKLCRELSLPTPSPEKVASQLELEHVALCDAGVLSDDARAAAAAAKQAGALAAKASGPQGALLSLVYENDAGRVSAALSEKGYAAYKMVVSKKGMASEHEE